MTPCLACLEPVPGNQTYHPACLRALFGDRRLPRVEVRLATLHTVGLEIAGKVALSGVQRKLAMRLSADGAALEPAPERSRFILKPQAQTFPNVPESEHLTMRLAHLFGIAIPPCALLRLPDETLAFVSRRFDRTDEGHKLRMEDFCQLAERPSKDRYTGSAELCARVVRRYASEPLIEMLKLFRVLLFSWWVGNGDLHLKNLSLLAGPDGLFRLSPAYDLVNTRLVLGDDELALPVSQKKRNLTRRSWTELGAYCRLPSKVVEKELARIHSSWPDAQALVARAFLPEPARVDYAGQLAKTASRLTTGR